MDNKKGNKELQLELNNQIADGVYANLVIVSHSDSEFIFDFARMLPGKPKATIHSRVIMNPKNAKLFLNALQDNISKFEKKFGTIKGGDGAPPKFNLPSGDETVN